MSTLLTRHMENYLGLRRALGFKLDSSERDIRSFIRFAECKNRDHITTALFLQWKSQFGRAGHQTWAQRLNNIRIFATWLKPHDQRTEIPAQALAKLRVRRPDPYIYSDQEFFALVGAASRLGSRSGVRSLSYKTFLLLLFVTGIRVGEALALELGSFDFDARTVDIKPQKSGLGRILPLQPSVLRAIKNYIAARDKILGWSPSWLFVNEYGQPMAHNTAGYNFIECSRAIGLRPTSRKWGRGPRLHDLRHTYAVNTLTRWLREGLDPRLNLIHMTRYLGHNSIISTYWYIEAVPQLLQLVSRNFDKHVREKLNQ